MEEATPSSNSSSHIASILLLEAICVEMYKMRLLGADARLRVVKAATSLAKNPAT
jgi:hypothetical protein